MISDEDYFIKYSPILFKNQLDNVTPLGDSHRKQQLFVFAALTPQTFYKLCFSWTNEYRLFAENPVHLITPNVELVIFTRAQIKLADFN